MTLTSAILELLLKGKASLINARQYPINQVWIELPATSQSELLSLPHVY